MDETVSTRKIYISHTEREWRTIEKKLSEKGKKHLTPYVKGQIKSLQKKYLDDKNEVITGVPKMIRRYIQLTDEELKILDVINLKTGIPISTLIDRFIIEPLMMPLE